MKWREVVEVVLKVESYVALEVAFLFGMKHLAVVPVLNAVVVFMRVGMISSLRSPIVPYAANGRVYPDTRIRVNGTGLNRKQPGLVSFQQAPLPPLPRELTVMRRASSFSIHGDYSTSEWSHRGDAPEASRCQHTARSWIWQAAGTRGVPPSRRGARSRAPRCCEPRLWRLRERQYVERRGAKVGQLWRLDLIDRDDEPDFEKILGEFELLDVSRRNKFVFQLTIWKSRNDALNQLEYRQGFSYRFNRVHSLELMYGNPLGSMQIRHRLGAEPLVSAQTPANSHGQLRTPPQAAVVSREEHLHHDSATAAPVNVSAASPELPAHAGEGHTPPQSSRDEETYVVTLAEKPLTKRRSRADEEIEVPPKQRKQSRKALCFESPPRPTVCR
ncbi:hypothetical protein PF008_g12954 [Phytophthora fragariae]|uniref:Uncharacterized protein n=1 Tax=Phytophthora fragariae TaxID=53985 RepID=A0A6G0RLD3_9STRA|nr:hypothetical protein PF008_g12954 [Phytophthora fragariae]